MSGGLPASPGLPTGGWPSGGLATGGLPAGGLPAFGTPVSPGACGTVAAEGQGATGGVDTHVCLGAGLAFVGPAIGQIATVIGPTVIGPAVIGTSVQSAGDVIAVP